MKPGTVFRHPTLLGLLLGLVLAAVTGSASDRAQRMAWASMAGVALGELVTGIRQIYGANRSPRFGTAHLIISVGALASAAGLYTVLPIWFNILAMVIMVGGLIFLTTVVRHEDNAKGTKASY